MAAGAGQRLARGIRTRLQNIRIDEIFQSGLHEFLTSSSPTTTASARRSPSNI